MASFYSNSYDGRQLSLDVWQEGGYAKWKLSSYGGNSAYYTIYNTKITINGTVVYNPGTVAWNSRNFPAAKGSTEGSVWVGHSASGRNISVSFIGEVYYNRTTDHGGNVWFNATISVPTLSAISTSSISDSSVYASFSVTSANNGNIADYYMDIFTDSTCTNKVETISSNKGTFTGLNANRTYYIRGNSSNEAGRAYTAVKSITTTFTDPSAPSNLRIECSNPEPIIAADYTFKWNAAGAGSTAVAGYRLRIYKNDVELESIDTESTSTQYTINAAAKGFTVGDRLKFGLYSYSKDWAGNKHFNGGGSGSAQVISSAVTMVSDKFIYLSENGGTFTKYKVYISVNGGSFTEIKKEKLKIIS